MNTLHANHTQNLVLLPPGKIIFWFSMGIHKFLVSIMETFSPVSKIVSVRLLIFLATMHR
ncbi:hypothetical protein EPI10_031217 [Gossypium australe]|uniref:Uncharacterized protein n=1 Tax=Gossypium australe TaxID=47621 RepID=A0A5B6X0S8_9ROSI|nr:hypothetical protein EPI10_031217 [Gossypium australe]